MIGRINKIKLIGVFTDFTWDPAKINDFKKFNAFYGWNGSGKTTISRLFSILESGKNSEFELSPESTCILSTTTGNRIISAIGLAPEDKAIKVFNEDFVRDNLEWVKTKATPILIIGKEKIDQSERLETVRKAKLKYVDDLKHINANLNMLDKDKGKILEKCRKAVVNELTAITDIKPKSGRATEYRNYTTTDVLRLLTDALIEFPNLTDDRKIERKTTLSEKDAKQKIDDYVAEINVIDEIIEKIADLNKVTISNKVITTLESEISGDDELREWMRHGHHIHSTEDKICKFCKNEISAERYADIDAYFDEAQIALIDDINFILELTIDIPIPEPEPYEKLYKQFHTDYVKARESFFVEKLNLKTKIDAAVLKLKNKRKRPFEKLDVDTDELNMANDSLITTFTGLNSLITFHNAITDQFHTNRMSAAHDLELHLIGTNKQDFDEKDTAIKKLTVKRDALLEELGRNEIEEGVLSQELRDHGIAANAFNKMLMDFLGRSEIMLKAEDVGYQIERSGKPAKNLSEGERNAIALIFFLTKLTEDGFDPTKGIIVIDDPVSSFDSQHIYQAFSFIKSKVKQLNPSQLFILTHNFHFFRQLRNWYKHESAECYCVKSKSLPGSVRFSVIEPLDPLLLKHNSEYSYLFKLVHDRANTTDDPSLSEDYIFPNVLRKLLENYLSMKVPLDGIDIHGKLTKLLADFTEDQIPASVKSRVESFCQDNSHPLYQDSPMDFDERLMGELKAACKDILLLIEVTDKKHYGHLISQVTAPTVK